MNRTSHRVANKQLGTLFMVLVVEGGKKTNDSKVRRERAREPHCANESAIRNCQTPARLLFYIIQSSKLYANLFIGTAFSPPLFFL